MFNVLFSPKRLMRKSSFSQRKDRLSCGYQAFLDRREALKDCEEGYRSDINDNYCKYSSSSEYYSDYSASPDPKEICQLVNDTKLKAIPINKATSSISECSVLFRATRTNQHLTMTKHLMRRNQLSENRVMLMRI